MDGHSIVCGFVIACCVVGPLLPARAQVEDPNRTIVTIVDGQGVPLAGVQVTEYAAAGQFTTDANGRFDCEPSDQVRYFYAVDRQRRLAEGERLDAGGRRLEMKLAPARIVSGRVADPNGRPVRGVRIAALPMTNFYVLTDNEGRYDVGWRPEWGPGAGLCLMAHDAGRNLAALVSITPETSQADFALEPGLTLVGLVQDPHGRPVPHAMIRLDLARGWTCGTPVEDVESDSQGRWRIPALPQKQEYHVSASAPGYGRGTATSGRINVASEVGSIDPIIVKPSNCSVSGTVIDVNGLPVEGAGVVLRGEGQSQQKATTDRQGRFTMASICDGPFDLFAVRDREGRREGSGQILNVGPGVHEIVLFPERQEPVTKEEPPFEPDPQAGVLKYRWSDRGGPVLEGKQWQRIQMSADRPPDVDLPDPGYGASLWGKWSSPAVKSGYRWIVLTRAYARGQYDRLVMDTDGDGRLDDETVVAAYTSSQPSEHSYLTAFGPIQAALDRSSGLPIAHLSFGFYASNQELIVHSRGWFEGNVSIAGEATRCLLVDKDADGTFATYSSDPASTDLIGLGDEEHRTAYPLGRCVAIRGGFYEVRIAQGREHVKIDFTQVQNLPCGAVRLPVSVGELTIAGENGCFTLVPQGGLVRLPAGAYRVIRWRSERNDEQGHRWTLTGHSFDGPTQIEVTANRETDLAVGEPVFTSLQQIRGTTPPYRFEGPRLTGRWGETVALECDGPAARSALRIRADDGSYDRTFTFEYG